MFRWWCLLPGWVSDAIKEPTPMISTIPQSQPNISNDQGQRGKGANKTLSYQTWMFLKVALKSIGFILKNDNFERSCIMPPTKKISIATMRLLTQPSNVQPHYFMNKHEPIALSSLHGQHSCAQCDIIFVWFLKQHLELVGHVPGFLHHLWTLDIGRMTSSINDRSSHMENKLMDHRRCTCHISLN